MPQIVPVYLDEPLHGSPLALLSAAVECDAVVTADVARADMTDLLPREQPWLTWVTRPRVPAFAAAGPKDALLVADAGLKGLAVDAGWPADRVQVARWPDLPAIWAAETDEHRRISNGPGPLAVSQPASVAADCETAIGGHAVLPKGPYPSGDSYRRAGPNPNDDAAAFAAERAPAGLAIIADTSPVDAPERLDDFSSQRLLWNSIRMEIEAEPLILAGVDPAGYLEDRLKRFSVSGEGLDRGLFVERLILPCYGQGIARLLLGAGLPLRLFGGGWGDLPEFAPYAAGPVLSRAALKHAAAGAAALVHVWPMTHAHPIESAGRPLVRPVHKRTDTFIRAAIDAMKSAARGAPTPALGGSGLSIESIALIAGFSSPAPGTPGEGRGGRGGGFDGDRTARRPPP